jgi:hypothetical protein
VVTVAVVPASAEKETFAEAHQKVPQPIPTQGDGKSQQETATESPQTQETIVTPSTSEEVTKAGNEEEPEGGIGEQPVVDGNPEPAANLELTPEEPAAKPFSGTGPSTQFVAELEAIVPKPLNVKLKEDSGPVELEAPHQTFKLPPRPIAATENPEKEVPRTSDKQLDDFFKIPSNVTNKPGMKPKDFGGSNTAEPIRPLKLKLTKKDGKIVPVQVSSPSGTPTSTADSPKLKLKVDAVADIIENISWTPTSPIHSRAASTASSNSAQRWSHRSSRSLGPPAQAPAPPAPGGRPMVEPDFATAGQFEGERKQKKKKKDSNSGAGSKSGWKAFFRHSSANNNGSTGALESTEGSSTAPTTQRPTSASGPTSERIPSPVADMMTTSGKDVLWFRGNGKKTVSAA